MQGYALYNDTDNTSLPYIVNHKLWFLVLNLVFLTIPPGTTIAHALIFYIWIFTGLFTSWLFAAAIYCGCVQFSHRLVAIRSEKNIPPTTRDLLLGKQCFSRQRKNFKECSTQSEPIIILCNSFLKTIAIYRKGIFLDLTVLTYLYWIL